MDSEATPKAKSMDSKMQSLMERGIAREKSLSAMLMTYILSGLVFMLLPGTFLGVWNLISISRLQALESITPGWIQAHGHAQIFGWVATFILGIGFYSIPKLRKMKPFAMWRGWTCWSMWTIGVLLRWTVTIWPWHWRVLMPFATLLEFAAFLLFFMTIGPAHSSTDGPRKPWDVWIFAVIAATSGLMLSLMLQVLETFSLARAGTSPAFPHEFDQRYLVVSTWGFLVPMVWGFSARWLPVFLGLRPMFSRVFVGALAANSVGVVAALLGYFAPATILIFLGSVCAAFSIRILEPSIHKPKIVGVHRSFPLFVRSAYVWLMIAGVLGIWAEFNAQLSPGIWGASRHALTVGFVAAMVFSVGQRILPSFAGMRALASPRLMFAGLALLMVGCTLRVSAEILAYQNYAGWAWNVLPVSALIEMTAVTLFAVNLGWTFLRPPVVVQGPLTQFVE
ncbi:MAG: NnrS family protein [Candidatus Acidiferrum sp.]